MCWLVVVGLVMVGGVVVGVVFSNFILFSNRSHIMHITGYTISHIYNTKMV